MPASSLKSAPVFVGQIALTALKKFFSNNQAISGIFILTDGNAYKYCFPILLRSIPVLKTAVRISIKAGEQHKTIDSCSKIWEALIKNKADRKSLLINLGGGMTGDMGGFAASAFMRGISFINVPTTLLAMVDASVGGKTGVNFNNYKNQIGFFNNPRAVFIYPGFLKTLPRRELLSGFAEVIKHALVADKSYWKKIRSVKTVSYKTVEDLIVTSVQIKNKITGADPSEKGERKKLNFGHTVGHAVESYSLEKDREKLLHGEAIAIGIICESYLSYKTNQLSKDELNDISLFILSKYKHYAMNASVQRHILKLMRHDKKNEEKKINFSLIREIGNAETDHYCDDKLILESLNYYNLAAGV